MANETALTNKVIKTLKEQYGDAICIEKRFGSGYGKNGQPDLNICIAGQCVQIEMKDGINKPTQLQQRRLEEWERAGAVVGVAWSVAEVVGIVEKARTSAETRQVVLFDSKRMNGRI